MRRSGPAGPPAGRRTSEMIAVCLLLGALTGPQSLLAIKIADYNILNYDGVGSCDTDREPSLRTVLSAIDADIVCVQEVVGAAAGANAFLTNVLNDASGPGGYTLAPFINGPDTDNALYFRSGIIVETSLNISTQPTGIRDWSYHRIRLEGYDVGTEEAKLHIFIGHLKAGSTDPNPAIREFEADKYRDWAESNLPDGANVLCIGDFNLESSSEGAWTMFTETRATNKGQLQDPVNQVGTWSNSPGFALVHTQAPQLAQTLPCSTCGYAGGGMDDRFDFILTSATLHNGIHMIYTPGTYRTFGNDGNHYNTAINALPVIPEGQVVADALACASDHMPVVLELTAPALLDASTFLLFGSFYVGAVAEQTLEVENIAPVPAQVMLYNFTIPSGFSGPTGSYIALAGNGPTQHTITMSTDTAGTKNANLMVNSTAVEPSTADVLLAGSVLNHAVSSTQSGSQVLVADLDFGTHDVGQFSDQVAEVHNVDYAANSPFQGLLEVYDHNITGDPRFSVVGFAATNVGATPAMFTVHFDDAGAGPGVYNATLEFLTRDDPQYAGAIDQDTVTYNLSATVPGALPKGDLNHNGVVDMPDIPLFVALLLDPSGATPEDQNLADMNGDMQNDGLDLQPFIDAF